MKLTLQADDVRHFRRLAAALIGKPQTAMVQFVVYRNKLAMVLDWYGWMLVMPIRGRKPTKPFRVPLAPLLKVGERAEGKMSVRIDEKKELLNRTICSSRIRFRSTHAIGRSTRFRRNPLKRKSFRHRG